MARWLAVLIVSVATCAHAADFSAGLKAYARGDYRQALAAWRALANEGDPRAQYRLARMYAEGTGVSMDQEAALQWYRKAAELGSVEARHEIALAYSLGRGVRRDPVRAAHWYESLAEDGYANSQYLLAMLYEDGEGVPRDLARAAFWYRRAARQGLVRAQARLGTMLAQGLGVARDPVVAWAWLDLAAGMGHDAAARQRTRLRPELSEEQLARAAGLSRELQQSMAARGREDREEPDAVEEPEMVRISAGCFGMGSDTSEPGRADNETQRFVCISGFSLSRFEVTRRDYAKFAAETRRGAADGCQVYGGEAWRVHGGRSWRDPGFPQTGDHPVVCVSRGDALAYAAWLSLRHGRAYRLPTEAEWEYAARAGTAASRPWGNDADEACGWANVGDRRLKGRYPEWPWTIHRCDDGYVHTAPVGSFRVNRHGIHDIVGNVWEWTCSGYEPAYEGAERRCAPDSRVGVVRGGSWSNSPRWARLAGRFENPTVGRFDLVGFRLAHD